MAVCLLSGRKSGGGPLRSPIFSVQRLHGFRQVVQHVQLHVAKIGLIDELKHTHGRLRIEGPQE